MDVGLVDKEEIKSDNGSKEFKTAIYVLDVFRFNPKIMEWELIAGRTATSDKELAEKIKEFATRQGESYRIGIRYIPDIAELDKERRICPVCGRE